MTTPTDEQTLRRMAEQHAQKGDIQQAYDCYRELCLLNPADAQHWHMRGAFSGMLGNFADTVTCCEKALALTPDEPALYANYARALMELNRDHESLATFRQALTLDPDDYISRIYLGKLHRKLGNNDEAIDCFQKALEITPDSAGAMDEVGQAYFASAKYSEALYWHEKATELRPREAIYRNNLGNAYLQLGRYRDAETAFQESIRLNPELLVAYCNLAYLHSSRGHYDEAIRYYDHVLELSSQYEPALAGKGVVLERQGKYEMAFELIKPVMATGTWSEESALTYARLSPKFGFEQEAIRILEQTLNRTISQHNRIQTEFTLGMLLDRTGRYDEAFLHAKTANELSNIHFNRAAHQQLVDAMISVFSRKNIGKLPLAGNPDAGVVFIVGMPRSGTTLVEQILATHPGVFGAGELNAIRDLAVSLSTEYGGFRPFPAGFEQISNEILDTLSHAYTGELHGLASDEKIILDKMPANFMFLGLIERLLPNAKIIHCMRNPMDTCLSCYFQNFSVGQDFSYDLSNLAFYYNAYLKLMDHWRSVLKLPILEVRYEELVSGQESTTRNMLDFIGIDWDPACLDFHKTGRKVVTASYEQVRNPIYTSSVGKWKNYQDHLRILRQELACKI